MPGFEPLLGAVTAGASQLRIQAGRHWWSGTPRGRRAHHRNVVRNGGRRLWWGGVHRQLRGVQRLLHHPVLHRQRRIRLRQAGAASVGWEGGGGEVHPPGQGVAGELGEGHQAGRHPDGGLPAVPLAAPQCGQGTCAGSILTLSPSVRVRTSLKVCTSVFLGSASVFLGSVFTSVFLGSVCTSVLMGSVCTSVFLGSVCTSVLMGSVCTSVFLGSVPLSFCPRWRTFSRTRISFSWSWSAMATGWTSLSSLTATLAWTSPSSPTSLDRSVISSQPFPSPNPTFSPNSLSSLPLPLSFLEMHVILPGYGYTVRVSAQKVDWEKKKKIPCHSGSQTFIRVPTELHYCLSACMLFGYVVVVFLSFFFFSLL